MIDDTHMAQAKKKKKKNLIPQHRRRRRKQSHDARRAVLSDVTFETVPDLYGVPA